MTKDKKEKHGQKKGKKQRKKTRREESKERTQFLRLAMNSET